MCFLEQGETYKSVSEAILKISNIQCYVKFINDKCKNNYTLDEPHYKFNWGNDCKNDDLIVNNVICFFPPCLKLAANNNYCSFHNKDMI